VYSLESTSVFYASTFLLYGRERESSFAKYAQLFPNLHMYSNP